MEFDKIVFAALCVLAAASIAEATLSKRDKKTKTKTEKKVSHAGIAADGSRHDL